MKANIQIGIEKSPHLVRRLAGTMCSILITFTIFILKTKTIASSIMIDLKRIKRPVLLLDEQKCRRNISAMARKAYKSGITFRPHFKTHQSATIGGWFRDEGVRKITVSSLIMCRHFMASGWDDITVAFPANPREADEFNEVAGKIKLNLLFSDFEQMVNFTERFSGDAGAFIKIDTGYKRSGVDWNHLSDIERIVEYLQATNSLRIEGFLTHSGHTYSVRGVNNILDIYCDTIHKLKHTIEIAPIQDLKLSIGDTPTCSVVNDFTGINEIRPGNFVFYDLMQTHIGSCVEEDVAVALAAPVVSVTRHRGEAVIYGGAVHLSKDSFSLEDGLRVFGKVYRLTPEGWNTGEPLGYITALSQEHGILTFSSKTDFRAKPGDLLAIIPVHSCLTADLMRGYMTLRGEEIRDLCGK